MVEVECFGFLSEAVMVMGAAEMSRLVLWGSNDSGDSNNTQKDASESSGRIGGQTGDCSSGREE